MARRKGDLVAKFTLLGALTICMQRDVSHRVWLPSVNIFVVQHLSKLVITDSDLSAPYWQPIRGLKYAELLSERAMVLLEMISQESNLKPSSK